MTRDWIIGIGNSAVDGVRLLRFRGSKEEVKEKLLSLINEDKENDIENWDYGCETTKDIRDECNGHGWEYKYEA